MNLAVVNKCIGSIKQHPDEASENADEVLFGMNVTILKELSGDWYYIRTHYNYEGYIKGSSLIINDETAERWGKEKNSVVMNNFADVLNEPEASGYEIATMTRGANIISLNEVSKNEKFVKVQIPDGRYGWMRKNFLNALKTTYNLEDEDKLREELVNNALRYIGTQYRWGGKTPMGIDCSGLCSMSYMLSGILIYRDADIKEEFPVKEIMRDTLKKGDLIFFPGHVAMYIGNDKYVHSSTSNDIVAINSFDKSCHDYNKYLDEADKRFGSIFN